MYSQYTIKARVYKSYIHTLKIKSLVSNKVLISMMKHRIFFFFRISVFYIPLCFSFLKSTNSILNTAVAYMWEMHNIIIIQPQ